MFTSKAAIEKAMPFGKVLGSGGPIDYGGTGGLDRGATPTPHRPSAGGTRHGSSGNPRRISVRSLSSSDASRADERDPLVRQLSLRANASARAARRTIHNGSPAARDTPETLQLLAQDAFHPQQLTPKLKGKLERSWACSAGCDLRIVVKFIQHAGSEAILPEIIRTHGEGYRATSGDVASISCPPVTKLG